ASNMSGDVSKAYQEAFEKTKKVNDVKVKTDKLTLTPAKIKIDASSGEVYSQSLDSAKLQGIQALPPQAMQSIPMLNQDSFANAVPGIEMATNAVATYSECVKDLGNNAKDAQVDISGLIAGAIDAMASAISQIGQKGANPMKTFIDGIAGGMKSFGKQMITIGVGKQLLLSLGAVAPPVLIAGGVALEIAADLAMNSFKMASGGIVSGSTFANIGEYAGASHNPEVVAPLDKLRNMIGGTRDNMHYSFEMMGDRLLAVQDRVSTNNQFVLGTNNQ
ncbi:MAG TPA: hypothetical protein VK890_07750, partial [Bacteroidia bacterium]|nr:hypothetical protein [Bacteroidia bacterium]